MQQPAALTSGALTLRATQLHRSRTIIDVAN